MQNLIELRHILHAHPELSGHEALTNKILNEWVKQTLPDQIIEKIGGYGLAAIYIGEQKILRSPLRLTLWRPSTDNDRGSDFAVMSSVLMPEISKLLLKEP